MANAQLDDFLRRLKEKNKTASIWTIEQGCLAFTSLIIFYLLFLSSQSAGALDIIVTIFFLLGALIFFGSSSMIKKLTREENPWRFWLQRSIEYIFMVLSFLPGIYFAFRYEEFILRFYLLLHLITSGYFLYKRYKEFELEPFAIGVAMSFALASIHPIINGFFWIFGSGWFVSTLSSLVVTSVDVAIAVAFMLRLPEQHLPANMMFGLKVVKYFMFLSYWQTWFFLMVFASWRNIGATAETLQENIQRAEAVTSTTPTTTTTTTPSGILTPSAATTSKREE